MADPLPVPDDVCDRSFLLLLGAALSLGLLLRAAFFVGFYGYDDFAYAHTAINLLHGDFHFLTESPRYVWRFFVTVPTALSYRLFGVNQFSSILFPFLCSVGNILLIGLLGKNLFHRRAGAMAAFLCAVFPMNVLFGTMLFPEEIFSFFTGSAVLLFLSSEKGSLSPRAGQWLAGLAVVLSYLSRETGLFLLPVFWVWLGQPSRGHVRVALPAMVYLAAESMVAYHYTGDLFHHYHAAQADCAEQALAGLNQHGFFTYLSGVFGGNLYGLSHFGFFYFIFAAALVFFARNGRIREISLPLVWSLPFALYHQFGVVGFSPFLPVPKMFRYLCILTFPVLLIISAFLSSLATRPKHRWASSGMLVFLFVTSVTGTWFASRKHRAYFFLEGGAAKYGSFAEAIETRSPEIVGVPNLFWKYRMKYFLARRGEKAGRIPVIVALNPGGLSGKDGVIVITSTPSPANDFSFCKIILRHQQDLLLDCKAKQGPA